MKSLASFFLGAALLIATASCAGGSDDPTPSPMPSPTATPTGTAPASTTPTAAVSPTIDLNAEAFAKYGYRWKTDFAKKSIELSEIVSGVPARDGVPPLNQPKFVTIESASATLKDQEPVLVYANGGEIRAYPIQILIWHEIVNDVVGGKSVAVTYSPVSNTPIVFDRTVDGNVLRFGTTGFLRKSNLVMWDSQTESWWQQANGSAIVGENNGKKLAPQESQLVSFGDFKAVFPTGKVLSTFTGFDRRYGNNIYVSYDSGRPFAFSGKTDERLPAMERVLGVSQDNAKRAYPFRVLKDKKVINEKVGSSDIVVFWKSGAVSALDSPIIAESKNVGAATAFSAVLNNQKLTFEAKGDLFTDKETGSDWNVLGMAVDGPMKGSQLKALIGNDHFWFAWAAFNPETTIAQ